MEWWPFLIFHRGGLRIKVINNTGEEIFVADTAEEAIALGRAAQPARRRVVHSLH